MSHYPGEIIKQYIIQGPTGGSVVTLPTSETTMVNSDVSILIESSEEIVQLEVNLQISTSSRDELVSVKFFRDTTELFETISGIAPAAFTTGTSLYTSWLDRPGPGTFSYSVKTYSIGSNLSLSDTWVKYTRILSPISITTLTTNNFTF